MFGLHLTAREEWVFKTRVTKKKKIAIETPRHIFSMCLLVEGVSCMNYFTFVSEMNICPEIDDVK